MSEHTLTLIEGLQDLEVDEPITHTLEGALQGPPGPPVPAGADGLVLFGDAGAVGIDPRVSFDKATGKFLIASLAAAITWNNAAETFTAWDLNVTDTASAAASKLLDLRVGGASKFSVDKAGSVFTPKVELWPVAGTAGLYQSGGVVVLKGIGLQFAVGSTTVWTVNSSGHFLANADNTYDIGASGANRPRDIHVGRYLFGNAVYLGAVAQLDSGGLRMRSISPVSWSSTADAATGVADVLLYRGGAGILEQRNGASAQTLRLYNTYTDASNYERLRIGWTSNVLHLLAEAAGTGLARTFLVGNSGSGAGMVIVTSNTQRWEFNGNGHIVPSANISYDIGSTSSRARNVYAQTVNAESLVHIHNSAAALAQSGVWAASDAAIGFSNVANATLLTGADVKLYRGGAGVLEQRNGSAAQEFRLYHSDDGAGNYIRAAMRFSGAALHIGTEHGGTGSAGATVLMSRGAGIVYANSAGFHFVGDNVRDIGSSTADRPRVIYAGTAFEGPRVNAGTFHIGLSNGNNHASVGSAALAVGSQHFLGWSDSTTNSNSGIWDLRLYRDAAGILALRNGASAQTLRIYNDYTDASNWDRASLGMSGVYAVLQTESAGTGVARHLALRTAAATSIYMGAGGVDSWIFKNTGHFVASADNTYDIGASGANRPRNLYVGTSIVAPLAAIDQPAGTARFLRFRVGGVDTGYVALGSNDLSLYYSAPTGGDHNFQVGGSSRWQINSAGHLLAGASDAYDIGLSTSMRPRDVFISRDLAVGRNAGIVGNLTLGQLTLSRNSSLNGAGTVQNVHATGFSGLEYLNNTGTVKAYIGLEGNNVANQPLRIHGISGVNHYVNGVLTMQLASKALHVYNDYTDASNYERGVFQWASNVLTIGVENAGTGLARNIKIASGSTSSVLIATGGSDRWRFDSSGHLTAEVDNTYDFGTSGATGRPRNAFIGTAIYVGGGGSGSVVMGGSGTSGVRLKTTSGLVEVRLGDDSAPTTVGVASVKFPATQVPSADLNTLDDYEEGTFTPTMTLGGASVGMTYTVQAGKYTKVGNVVTFTARVALSAKGSSTGGAVIAGLPFMSAGGTAICAMSVHATGIASGPLSAYVNTGVTAVNITVAATGAGANDTNVTNTTDITVSGTYFV